MIVVGGNLWAEERQIPHILDLHRTSILAPVRQRNLAGRADRRIVVTHLVDMIGVRVGAVMARMARLAAGLPPAGHPYWARRRGGRIGRRWFGRILRMLVEARFQVSQALAEIGVHLLELR
jgi:hypothetical protein